MMLYNHIELLFTPHHTKMNSNNLDRDTDLGSNKESNLPLRQAPS